MRRVWRTVHKGDWFWPCKFFHGFLSRAEPEEIIKYINRLKKEAESLEKSIVEIAVYSGGSISWQDAYMMSNRERAMAVKTINNYNKIKAGKPVSDDL